MQIADTFIKLGDIIFATHIPDISRTRIVFASGVDAQFLCTKEEYNTFLEELRNLEVTDSIT
jgi:hypothetical protein